jgi:hypothetical protein
VRDGDVEPSAADRLHDLQKAFERVGETSRLSERESGDG